MKKLGYLLSLATALTLFSCKKNDTVKQLAEINQDIQYSDTANVPDLTTLGIPAGFPIPGGFDTSISYSFATNVNDYLKQYNTSADKVISTKMKKLAFRILSPGSNNFNFLDSVKIFVYGQGLPEKLAAYKIPSPKNVSYFELDIVDQDLKEYFLKDYVYVRLYGRVNAVPPSNTNINITTTWTLKANPLN